MLAEDRRARMLKFINNHKSAKVNQLTAKFNISGSTVRRDLEKLEEQDLISRTHGGAVAKEGNAIEPSFMEKENENDSCKVVIAKKAAKLVNNGDTIILDAGTTTTKLAKQLNRFEDLTIVTNAINIALKLVDTAHEIIIPGGNLKKRTLALVGPATEDYLAGLHADKVFLGANGVDLEAGITTPDLVEANVKKRMADKAKEVIVLADYSKFNAITLVKVLEIEQVDKLVTDNNLSQELVQQFSARVELL
jgi:DeoR family fructose operon transcriptional repressor